MAQSASDTQDFKNDEEQRAKMAAYKRESRKTKSALGLCNRCTARPATQRMGKIGYCFPCVEYYHVRYAERRPVVYVPPCIPDELPSDTRTLAHPYRVGKPKPKHDRTEERDA